ncbi:DNA cytosine methyltransferase [Labrys portucalensis]|uniref:DNA (cytosine-5-)-methyltransferase n=1 Tax=Labrys neptuniae TaxID=376174 RepID=A0ABV6Z9E6_9HYPH
MRELVIDSFAGGGGASEGIRQALGFEPDIAVNHDRYALAMHRANYRNTRHMLQDVATVDSVSMFGGQPIGMLWMSPDCTDHSKAKGAAPRREKGKTTRGIGWAIFGWVKVLPKWQMPRVIFLENVEEYVDWGPLLPNGQRCPKRKGETFKAFVAAWEALGYVVEWRERRAWWSGAATIRKRLFMVMRRDGKPIVWPDRQYGNPNDAADAEQIAAGNLKTWPIIANCIDYTLPIPSVLDTREVIKAKLGLTAKRPLADNTEARIAKGVLKRVIQRALQGRPFMVKVNHTGRDETRDRGIDEPLSAMTSKRDDAIVMPFVAYAQQGGGVRPVDAPAHTFTASSKDQNVVVAPFMVPRLLEKPGAEPRSRAADEPSATITVSDSLPGHLISPYLVPRYGERPGQEPRNLACDRPGPTPVPTGNEGALVAAFMAQHSAGSHPGQPSKTLEEPMSTLTVRGTQQNLVAVSMMTMRGSSRRTAAADAPMRTDSAKGQHHAIVSMPLMTVYYGSDEVGGACDEPGRTDTAKARFGLVEALAGVPPFGPEHEDKARRVADFLRKYGCWDDREFVTIEVDGITLVLIDICMRMLTPRERYNANGFPTDYIIDHGIDSDGSIIRFTLEQQGHMCGNAVCPTEARDLVAANYQPRAVKPRPEPAYAPLLDAAE